MRRYDDPVDVRTGNGQRSDLAPGSPEQFLWRGQLWQVRGVFAHWVETAEWWRSGRARAVIGTEVPGAGQSGGATTAVREAGTVLSAPGRSDAWDDLLGEREVWRVEARRPVPGHGGERAVSAGVFELARDAGAGRWQLLGCSD